MTRTTCAASSRSLLVATTSTLRPGSLAVHSSLGTRSREGAMTPSAEATMRPDER